MTWFVYIIECTDQSLYTGITTDVNRRFQQHLDKKGAKYFRSRQPLDVVFVQEVPDRSEATRREIQIKAMNKACKLRLVKSKENLREQVDIKKAC